MKIFFSLDWNSFKGCLEVCRIWKDLLMSESFHKVGASVYRKAIHDELWHAVINGQTNEVRHILSSGMVDMNFKTKKGFTTLMCAAKVGHEGVVKLLLDRGANPNELTITTPLHVAAKYGHPDVVKVLLAEGAEPNILNKDGITPLIYPAFMCNEDVIKHLLDGGADANIAKRNGMTALQLAIAGKSKYMCPNFPDLNPIWPKITLVVELLLNRGADPNKANQTGETPLHFAAHIGHLDVVQCLLNRGAEPNTADHEGITAISKAILRGHNEIANILKAHGGTVAPT